MAGVVRPGGRGVFPPAEPDLPPEGLPGPRPRGGAVPGDHRQAEGAPLGRYRVQPTESHRPLQDW